MKVLKSFLIFICPLGLAATVAAAATLDIPPEVGQQVNVRSDSTPGWTPSAEQRTRAVSTVQKYLDALESGRFQDAYDMHAQLNRQEAADQFAAREQAFSALAGDVAFWRVSKITWGKDPGGAPFPGVYVAVDLVGKFDNVDRACGYIILHQPSGASAFEIMRRENNYLDNATAQRIETKSSKEQLAETWAQLSRHCPNYIPPT
jgi:hypothetical protein